jgi:hypothetical protein
MKVTCINDANRPNEIPSTRWVKKGRIYTVTRVKKLNIQNTYGFELQEIDLKPFSPYEYFEASRFGRPTEEPSRGLQEENILEEASL